MIDIKTLIELYDVCQLENLVAGLRFLPEKIVAVGFKETMKKAPLRDLRGFFAARGIDVEIKEEIVGRYDYDAIVAKLEEILDSNEDCCFDLTGGRELVLAAMGEVAARRGVPMLQINLKTGELVRVSNCDGITDPGKPAMTIAETVALNGGAVLEKQEGDTVWDITEDFRHDIEVMWDICRRGCSLWNFQSTVLANIEQFGYIDEEMCVRVNYRDLCNAFPNTTLRKEVLGPLAENGLISAYSIENNVLTFKYKNRQVHDCITKAGNILELYTYITALDIAREEPGYYDDIGIGVLVDWDGVVHDDLGSVRDTRNEIDIALMRDVFPVFISCKNGEVNKAALYEINAVAEKFGGAHVKKILLATYVSGDREKRKYILQRAEDMGITCITDVHQLTREEFAQTLRSKAK